MREVGEGGRGRGGGRWEGREGSREVDFIVFPCQGGEDKYPRNPQGRERDITLSGNME
jgi:hypothetical protein